MSFWETIWKSILLGTVQGLTEFLPVSSSGHLALLQRLLGFSMEDGSMTFVSLMLHAGTLFAVLFAFRREVFALFGKPRRLLMLAAATVPAAAVGLLFEERIDALFAGARGPLLLAVCFGVTAVLLLVCELTVTRRRRVRPFGWKNAAAMGLVQAVAILPGISRSGSTIAVGTLVGARGEEASKFSFLMSIPIILGGVVLGIKDAVCEGAPSGMGAANIVGLLLGVAAAAAFGLLAIKLMLRLMGKANYKWFALYLLLLSLATLWLDVLGLL